MEDDIESGGAKIRQGRYQTWIIMCCAPRQCHLIFRDSIGDLIGKDGVEKHFFLQTPLANGAS